MALYRLLYLVIALPWFVGIGYLARKAVDWALDFHDRGLKRIYTHDRRYG